MYDELKEEEIVNQVGGRFKLSTLIQKRLVQLNRGARSLINAPEDVDKMAVVLQEIRTGKIYLDTSSEVRSSDGSPDFMDPPELSLEDL